MTSSTLPKPALKNASVSSTYSGQSPQPRGNARRVALKVQNCRVHFIDEQGRVVTPRDGESTSTVFTTSLNVDIPITSRHAALRSPETSPVNFLQNQQQLPKAAQYRKPPRTVCDTESAAPVGENEQEELLIDLSPNSPVSSVIKSIVPQDKHHHDQRNTDGNSDAYKLYAQQQNAVANQTSEPDVVDHSSRVADESETPTTSPATTDDNVDGEAVAADALQASSRSPSSRDHKSPPSLSSFHAAASLLGHDNYSSLLNYHRRAQNSATDKPFGGAPGGFELTQIFETFTEALRRLAEAQDVLRKGIVRKSARVRKSLQRQRADQTIAKQNTDASLSQLKLHIDQVGNYIQSSTVFVSKKVVQIRQVFFSYATAQFCTQSLRRLRTDLSTLQNDTQQRINQLEENSGCLADEHNTLADSVERTFLQVDRDVVRLTQLIHEDSTVVAGLQQKLEMLRKLLVRLVNELQSTHATLNIHQSVLKEQTTQIQALQRENVTLAQHNQHLAGELDKHRTELHDVKGLVQKLSLCVAQLASPNWAPDWLAALGNSGMTTDDQPTTAKDFVPHVIVEPGQMQRVGMPLSATDIEKLLLEQQKRNAKQQRKFLKGRHTREDDDESARKPRNRSKSKISEVSFSADTSRRRSSATERNRGGVVNSVVHRSIVERHNMSNSSGIDEGGEVNVSEEDA